MSAIPTTAPMRLAAKNPRITYRTPSQPRDNPKTGASRTSPNPREARAQEVQGEEHHEPPGRAQRRHEEVVPLMGGDGGHQEEPGHQEGQRPHDDLGQHEALHVDPRERQQPGEEGEIRRELPHVAESRRSAGEQGGGGQLDQRGTATRSAPGSAGSVPRSRTHERTGMLSRSAMGVPQLGQADRGDTIDSWRGTR